MILLYHLATTLNRGYTPYILTLWIPADSNYATSKCTKHGTQLGIQDIEAKYWRLAPHSVL